MAINQPIAPNIPVPPVVLKAPSAGAVPVVDKPSEKPTDKPSEKPIDKPLSFQETLIYNWAITALENEKILARCGNREFVGTRKEFTKFLWG